MSTDEPAGGHNSEQQHRLPTAVRTSEFINIKLFPVFLSKTKIQNVPKYDLYGVVFGCETWSLLSREDCR